MNQFVRNSFISILLLLSLVSPFQQTFFKLSRIKLALKSSKTNQDEIQQKYLFSLMKDDLTTFTRIKNKLSIWANEQSSFGPQLQPLVSFHSSRIKFISSNINF